MKKILIGLGAFFALVIAAVLIVPSFIDWSEYRVEIAQKVKEATGRDLLIGGDIVFSLVPSPILRLDDIRLSNAPEGASEDMISVRQLDVRVALGPLLTGNVHVHSIRLIEPVVLLEVSENGTGNWVLGESANNSETVTPQRQSGEPIFDDQTEATDTSLPVQIDDFIIEKGEVIYIDRQNGTFEKVSDVNARFGIAALNGPFEAVGTAIVRDIPIGFEGSVGQIVHDRTASFASQIRFAHGATAAKISGTFVNLPEGPKVKGRVDVNGQSLANFISAVDQKTGLPGALDRNFSLKGEFDFGPSGISLGKGGLSFAIGEDKGQVSLSYVPGEKKTLDVTAAFSKLNGDIWLTSDPYVYKAPDPLSPVIELSGTVGGESKGRISAALSDPSMKKAKEEPVSDQKGPVLPKDLTAKISLNVEALIVKGEPIRRLQASLSMDEGEVALERLSAILPGAGEASLFGVAGERDGQIQFDGSLDVNVAHLRGALNWFDIDVSSVPTERLQQMILQTQISATPDEIRLYDVIAKLDGSTVSGATTVALRARPSFGANFALDRLNVDAYMGGTVKGQTPSAKESKTPEPKKPEASASEASPATSIADALEILNQFDANLVLSLGHLTYQKQDIRDLSLNATIFDGALELRELGVKNFAGLTLGGSGGLKKTDKGVMAENLSLSVQGKSFAGAAALGGLQDVMEWKKVGPFAVSATLNGNVLAPDVDVTANVVGGTVIVSGSSDLFPQPKLDATVNVQYKDIRTATRRLGLSYQPSGNPGPLDVNADVSFVPGKVTVQNLGGRIGKTDLSGEVSFLSQGPRPYLDAALKTGALRLDPFMPKEVQGSKSDSKSAKSSPRKTSTTPAGSSGKWSTERIDLSGLKSMDGKIRVQSSALTHKSLTAKNVELNADLKNGVLDISKAVADVFGGQANLTSQVKVDNLAEISSNFEMNGLVLGSLLKQFGNTSGANGGLNLSAQLNTLGQSQSDFVSNLNGVVDLGMQKVSVSGKGKDNSALALINFLSALSGKDPSKGLADVLVKADVKQGIATLSSASLVSAIANGTAGGSLDLPNWLMDVSGTLNMQQNALLGLLAQKAKMKSTYPFSFKGALDKPNVKLDTGGISEGGGLVIPLSSHAEKKGYGTLLRGVLGAAGVKTDAPAQQQETPANVPAPLPSSDGTIAPPPPPPGSGAANDNNPPSVEQQLLKGLGGLLKR